MLNTSSDKMEVIKSFIQIPEHSEQLPVDALLSMPEPQIYTNLKNSIKFILDENEPYFLFVLGRKGIGKTQAIRKALHQLGVSNYVYHQFKYGEHVKSGNGEIEVYDDFHYLCENVRQLGIETVISYLKDAMTKRRPIVISENSLLCYDFGKEYTSLVHQIEKPEGYIFVDYRNVWDPLIQEYYQKHYAIEIENGVITFILNASPNIRFVIRVLNRLNGVLTSESLSKFLGFRPVHITNKFYDALKSNLSSPWALKQRVQDLGQLLDRVNYVLYWRHQKFFLTVAEDEMGKLLNDLHYALLLRSFLNEYEQKRLIIEGRINEPLLNETRKRIHKALAHDRTLLDTVTDYWYWQSVAGIVRIMSSRFYELFTDRYLPPSAYTKMRVS